VAAPQQAQDDQHLMALLFNSFTVIPAQAGIQTGDALGPIAMFASMDFRLRGNDEFEVFPCAS
jgi:hypothetical protein